MTETTTKQGSGDGDGSESLPDLDLDLDFDLETLAAEPPCAPPVVPPEPSSEPEVVVFSRGSVIEAERPGAGDPASAPVAPPLPPPAGVIPRPASRSDLSGGVTGAAGDFDPIFASGGAFVGGDEGNAAATEPDEPLRWPDGGEVKLPGAGVEADKDLILRKIRGVAQGEVPASLPPRRGEIPSGSSPVAGKGEAVLPPRKRKGQPEAAPLPLRQESPFPPEDRPSRTGKGKGRETAVADEASKSLWGGRVHNDEEPVPAPNRRRTEAGLGARLKAIPPRRLAIGAAVCAAVVALFAIPWGGEGDDEGTFAAPPGESVAKVEVASEAGVARSQPLDQAAALAAITASTPEARILAQYSELAKESADRFFSATTVEELLAVVRDPARVEPLMREFYSRNALRTRQLLGLTLSDGDDAMIGNRVFWKAKVDLKEDGREDLVFEQLKTGSRKAFLVDWELAVNYNPMRWDAFAAAQPTDPIAMRAFVTLSTDYRPPFLDETKYVAFLLTHPDGATEVLAYAEREGEVARQLLGIAEDDYEVRAYLELRFPPDGTAGAEILGLVDSVDWIVAE